RRSVGHHLARRLRERRVPPRLPHRRRHRGGERVPPRPRHRFRGRPGRPPRCPGRPGRRAHGHRRGAAPDGAGRPRRPPGGAAGRPGPALTSAWGGEPAPARPRWRGCAQPAVDGRWRAAARPPSVVPDRWRTGWKRVGHSADRGPDEKDAAAGIRPAGPERPCSFHVRRPTVTTTGIDRTDGSATAHPAPEGAPPRRVVLDLDPMTHAELERAADGRSIESYLYIL